MILSVNIFKLLFLVLATPIGLLFMGIKRKLMARMQNRIGPPIWQPFYDVIKLFQKRQSDSAAKENIVFRIMPLIYLLTTFSLFLFLPFSIISFQLDFIFFIYIFILGGALYILLGIASNTPYGYIGSMRDMTLMLCYEIIFAIVIFTFVVFTGIQSLIDFNESWLVISLPIASACLFVIALVETRITPFDTVEAHTEIIGSVETEFSGRSLAFFEISNGLRLAFFTFLMSLLFFGFEDLLTFSIASLIMLFILTFCQATTCRYRMDQTLKILIIILFLAVTELIRINFVVW
jgi:formate hydrogenlyase subunit 4